jgi:23S rRNA pseudouridine1911/1915/1917 synthase
MKRLDLVLIARHPELSRRRAQDVIAKGQVAVGGTTVREAGLRTREDADVIWDPNRKAEPTRRIRLPLLHRDEHLVVIDKPAGLLTVPTSPHEENEDTVLGRIQKDLGQPGRRRPFVGVVHRLDRGTSGALVFALDPPTRTGLRSLFRAHRIERHYAALVLGVPRTQSGVVDIPIRDAYVSGRRGVAKGDEPSRDATTRWRVVERLGPATLLDITLDTGRQHQIRIHLAHVGLPVAGDDIYGGGASAPRGIQLNRPMLHARTLGFSHPATGRDLRVESPWPADFVTVLRRLRARGPRGPL